jgi:uncharacterized LabA/DUF88 family protein
MSQAAVLIDGGYLNYYLKTLHGNLKIDYQKLSDHLCRPLPRFRTYYYNCLPYQSAKPTPTESARYARMRSFIDRLNRIPRFAPRLGRLVLRYRADGSENFEQKQVDMLLGIDMVSLALKRIVSHIVLVAGDADFLPAIRVARDEGVIVTLAFCSRDSVNNELYDNVDERILLSRARLDECLLGPHSE